MDNFLLAFSGAMSWQCGICISDGDRSGALITLTLAVLFSVFGELV